MQFPAELSMDMDSDVVKVLMVDEIPSDCCGRRSTSSRKRRRPTMLTERTCPLSDDEDSDDLLSEINVVAVSEATSEEGEDDISSSSRLLLLVEEEEEQDTSSDMSLMDLSLENALLRSGTHSHLLSLFEENQKALHSLLQEEEEEQEDLFHNCQEESSSQVDTPASPVVASTPQHWHRALDFELSQSVRGIVALTLYCAAHASTYEFISNLAYEAVELDLEDSVTSDHQKSFLYATLLILGCLLGRYCGLVWDFVSPMAYRRVKWIYHNRLRCGASDARALYWLQQQGEVLIGCIHIVAYYMCYIGVVHFVQELAFVLDQRDVILADLPSALYEQAVKANRNNNTATLLYMCPSVDMSPYALFGRYTNGTAVAQQEWDPLACGYETGLVVDSFGPEDEQYFFDSLSRNSYEHFFGQFYEAALFDSVHHLLFYAGLAIIAMLTLKIGLGYSFWAGW